MNYSVEELQEFENELGKNGYLQIMNVKTEEDFLELSKHFGKFLPQYDGEYVWSIKADPRFDNHYHSLNTKKLSPHTECYEFIGTPPKYLALWCLTPPSCGGGYTTLMDAYQYFNNLDKDTVTHLKNTEFEFVSSSGIQESALGRTATHKLVDDVETGPIVRFSANCIDTKGDQVANKAINNFVDNFEKNHISFGWETGDFLIWDNHRVVHSRTSYQDRNRELRRVWLG